MSDWFDGEGSGKQADVKTLMDSGVPDLLWRMVDAGALVSVGRTSDGGAVSFTVTMDGRWRREYFRDSDDATDWLLTAVAAVEAEAERLSASPGSRKRSRRARDT